MEVSMIKNGHFFSSPSVTRKRNPPIKSKAIQIQEISRGHRSLKLRRFRLFAGASVSELAAEINPEEEWIVRDGKCKGREGIVELMECLEAEAIMGEDEGKEASDYNRRAHIFYKSSRVFQALKEETKQSSSPSST